MMLQKTGSFFAALQFYLDYIQSIQSLTGYVGVRKAQPTLGIRYSFSSQFWVVSCLVNYACS